MKLIDDVEAKIEFSKRLPQTNSQNQHESSDSDDYARHQAPKEPLIVSSKSAS
jgi:hypothetical protein